MSIPEPPLPNILMVSYNMPPYHFAGAGNQAVQLSKKLIGLGARVTMLTSSGTEKLFDSDMINQVPVVRLMESSSKIIRVLLFQVLSCLWWLSHNGRYDVIHIHGCTHLTTVIWIALGKLFGKKTLLKITASGVDDLESLKNYPVLGVFGFMLLKRVDGVIALTPELEKNTVLYVGSDKVFLIPNGVDTRRFFPVENPEQKATLREKLDLPDEGPILIYTGGLNPRKNIQFLVEAFAKVRASDPNARLLLVGPCKDKFKDYFDELKASIIGHNMSGCVIFVEEVSNEALVEYLQASDVFVFASTQEGLPSSPIEAMACGLPTVILELQGVTDWLYKQGRQAAIVTKDSPDEFAKAVLSILKDEDKAASMSRFATGLIEQRYSLDNVANVYKDNIYPALFLKN